jgi:predicted ATP-dependent endonuclease of OLD family
MTSRPETKPPPHLLTSVRVEGFRTLKDTTFEPGPMSALVGEPGTGKSNLLAAVRAILDPANAPLTSEDVTWQSNQPVRVTIHTASQGTATLQGHPPGTQVWSGGETPPVVFLPAALRAERVIAVPSAREPLTGPMEQLGPVDPPVLSDHHPNATIQLGNAEAAHGLVTAIEKWIEERRLGMVVLIEEPELFLSPQTQRYLYRLLRRLTAAGNQVLYSTHSPSFLNVARLNELVLTEHDAEAGTRLRQPKSLPADKEFRAYSEFDATRSELFLARAAVLVEGQTERLALPFVFHALGYDPDREGISIIECAGKPNIPVIARVATIVGIPFLAVHDRDASAGKKPNQAEQHLNRLIGRIAGKNRIELAPDFEGVARLKGHMKNKPARAWRSFADLELDDIPEELVHIVTMAVQLARR